MSTNMDQPELLEITPEINDFGRSQGLSRPTAATAATGEKARFMDTENALESASTPRNMSRTPRLNGHMQQPAHSKHTLSQVTVALEPLEHPPTLADSQEIALPQISFAPRVNGNLDSWLSTPAQHDVAVRRCPEPRPRLPILKPIIQLPAADYLVSVVIAVVGITDYSHWTTYGPCYEDGSKVGFG
ncbi:uncharacterized protein CCOS01_14288 [Colletotrichum costaricense]|uniref:Uncharacterized protein n=1 Tax=Colletotrichum costaricense TaxID=1209916 RepID=A0AAJ0DUM0_9PEZI|nr:uncharacterized protein CCOS01_14288 [Colletotrichum costaricense]KAK1513346.1 hypothetical protein CCOS01_14288 [Colletotrichum costaricense]